MARASRRPSASGRALAALTRLDTYAHLQELRASRLAAQLDNAAVLAVSERILLPSLRRATCGRTTSRPVPISEVRVLEIRAAHRPEAAVQSLHRAIAVSPMVINIFNELVQPTNIWRETVRTRENEQSISKRSRELQVSRMYGTLNEPFWLFDEP